MLTYLLRLLASRSQRTFARVQIVTSDQSAYLKLEVADTRWRRALGLMGRTALEDCDGMLFIYPHPRKVRLWMAHTPLALDAIFVNQDGRIGNIAHRLVPYSRRLVAAEAPARWVLEIAGGRAAQLGLAAGNQLHLLR